MIVYLIKIITRLGVFAPKVAEWVSHTELESRIDGIKEKLEWHTGGSYPFKLFDIIS